MNFSKESFINGELILINKPIGWTSFQVVNKIRWLIKSSYDLKKIKVGHAGTLDPLAQGLLIICTGKLTKKITEFQNEKKGYCGTFFLGATTPSFDLETEIDKEFLLPKLNDNILKKISYNFTGENLQTPPIFSAKRINGKRAYK